MERLELYQMIGLPQEIIHRLEIMDTRLNLKPLDTLLDSLMDKSISRQAYQSLKTYIQDDSDQMKMLYCQLECARRIYAEYQEKQIPDIIFIDTMKCFSRFIEECGKINGRLFFDRGWWTYRQISMNIFRIGTLEYQFEKYDGETVIGIHIPSDADLSKESVDTSLKEAAEFFQKYYPGYEYHNYTCDSWLLSPTLKTLLSEESRILAFQRRFHIIRENPEDKEFMQWLFWVPIHSEDYQKLPETTHLQRDVKKLLLHGGTIGAAYGIMDRKMSDNFQATQENR